MGLRTYQHLCNNAASKDDILFRRNYVLIKKTKVTSYLLKAYLLCLRSEMPCRLSSVASSQRVNVLLKEAWGTSSTNTATHRTIRIFPPILTTLRRCFPIYTCKNILVQERDSHIIWRDFSLSSVYCSYYVHVAKWCNGRAEQI